MLAWGRALGRRLAQRRRELALLCVAALCFVGLLYYYCAYDRVMARYLAERARSGPGDLGFTGEVLEARHAHDEASMVLEHAAADALARRQHDGDSAASSARMAEELAAVTAHVRLRNRTKVVICCISRDDFFGLGVNRAQVEDLGQHFADYRVIVAENDSSEAFRAELRAWAATNPRVKVLSKTFNLKKRPNLAFLAKMRNFYVDELRRPEYAAFGRVVVFDMDVSHRWPVRAMAASTMLPMPHFGVRCFHIYNEGFVHRDVLAFRSTAFAPDFKLAKVPDVVDLESMHFVYRLSKGWYDAGYNPDVDSCFGGIAAYARDALVECGYDEAVDECEHLPLNRCIKDSGRSIVLDTTVAVPFHYRTVVDGLLLMLLFSSCLPLNAAAFALGALHLFVVHFASGPPSSALGALASTGASLRGALCMCAAGLVAQAWFVAIAKDNHETPPWLCVVYAGLLEVVSTELALRAALRFGAARRVSNRHDKTPTSPAAF